MKIKNYLKSLIAPFIILAFILAGILFIIFSQDASEQAEIIKVNSYDGEDKDYVLESDKLKFTLDSQTTQFSVTMKDTGDVWYSNPVDSEDDSVAMTIEKDKLRSTLLLTYSTINGVDTLYSNYTYSMENQIYQIEQGDDYIKVYYSIGNVDKEYVIPPVIEEERLDALLDNLSKSDAMMITDYYKKYDINNLGKNDDKDELLERFPIIENNVIYVLRDTAKDNIKKKLEGIFEDAGYTYEDYVLDKENDNSESTSDKPVFNISMVYRLDGDDLVVEVPYDDIEYKEDYPIYYLTILPYFGAGGTDDDGFLFVPEGGGSIIEFNNGRTSQNSYYANVYGWDMAQDRDAVVHETRTDFGVFGEAKGNSSFICILEDGASYAAIQADISGRNNSYNFVNAVYNVTHREQYDVSDKYNGNMYVYEESLPEGESLVQRYCFIASNDYVDMANAYHDYLEDNYGEYFTANDDIQTPVEVEILGAVDKIKQVAGIPVSKPLELTTFEEAGDIIDQLTEEGITNLSVKLAGWANGGVNQKILKDIDVLSELGGKKGLKNLIAKASDDEVGLYIDGITNYAYDSDVFDGFLSFRDAARFVSKEKAEIYEYNTVSYVKREELDAHYLLKASLISDMMENLISAANNYGVGVSFNDVGKELSSDFNKNDKVSREASINLQTDILRQARDNGTSIMINEGNDYAVVYADMVTNMDLVGSEYSIIDYGVPFYQIALHGYVNYTGEPINMTQNSELELLKSAEYGAGLSFTFMDETSFTLQNTEYSKYFGAEYDAAHDNAIEIYTRYNDELGHTFNQRITDHEYVAESVTCTTYEDGTSVYVNYNYEDVTLDNGVTISSRDYKVCR